MVVGSPVGNYCSMVDSSTDDLATPSQPLLCPPSCCHTFDVTAVAVKNVMHRCRVINVLVVNVHHETRPRGHACPCNGDTAVPDIVQLKLSFCSHRPHLSNVRCLSSLLEC
jgi:hypothetical protein